MPLLVLLLAAVTCQFANSAVFCEAVSVPPDHTAASLLLVRIDAVWRLARSRSVKLTDPVRV